MKEHWTPFGVKSSLEWNHPSFFYLPVPLPAPGYSPGKWGYEELLQEQRRSSLHRTHGSTGFQYMAGSSLPLCRVPSCLMLPWLPVICIDLPRVPGLEQAIV